MEALPVDPIWAEAARVASETFGYGDLIPHDWLLDQLQLREPKVGSAATYRRYALDVLTRVEQFKKTMLEDYQRYLVNSRGEGYRIVHPTQQTSAAMGKLQRDLRKSVEKAVSALTHIDAQMLQLENFKENAEARAKVAWLSQQGTKQLAAR